MSIKNYDRWKLYNPNDNEVVVCKCEECREDIYQGEQAYSVDEGLEYGLFHEDCIEKYAVKSLRPKKIIARR